MPKDFIQIHIQESQRLFLVECIRLLATVFTLKDTFRLQQAMITVEKLKTLKESVKLLGEIETLELAFYWQKLFLKLIHLS